MIRGDRGVSSAVSTILLVAIVIVLASTVSVSALGVLEAIQEPAPNVAQSSGRFLPQDGYDGGIVRITHVSGDAVAVSEIEIVVRAECAAGRKEGRIVGLPAGSGNAIRETDGQIEGDNIFDERSLNAIDNAVEGIDDGGALLQGGRYTAGDHILFRIPSDKCSLDPGSSVSVRLVHVPSQAIIVDKDLRA